MSKSFSKATCASIRNVQDLYIDVINSIEKSCLLI